MAFMSSTKKGISALEMQSQLDHKRYGTVWRLMHKIREGMGKLDSLNQLNWDIEFDEGYFEQAISKQIKLKRGRGSQRQSKVAIMTESTPFENIETNKTSSQSRYFKMKVLESHNKEEVKQIIEYIN
jgi:hypothetical protein